MAVDELLVELRDRVLYLTLNRPEKLNAMNLKMMGELLNELTDAAANPEVGCVVLTGAGRGFCSGGDVKTMGRGGEDAQPALQTRVAALRRRGDASLLLHEMPKVTIAAVNGPAMGAGLGLAMACDLRIAADSARFGTAFARVGLSGDYGGTWTLTRLVGPAKARELYFLADIVSAEEALRIGLVNRVVQDASLRQEVDALAKKIANGPSIAYSYMKANLNCALTHEFRDVLDRESWTHTNTRDTEDHREAVKAFLEKREPAFKGR